MFYSLINLYTFLFIPTKDSLSCSNVCDGPLILQSALGELMEHVVFLLHLVDARKRQLNFPAIIRKELKETTRAVLRNITMVMTPSTYFKSIIKLLHHSDNSVGEKVFFLVHYRYKNFLFFIFHCLI